MEKILKLSFQTQKDWEIVKATLQDTVEDTVTWKKGIKSVRELGFMQKPPAADWQPDPNKPDDNGWTTYSNYSVDIVIEDYDYTDLKKYLIKQPKNVGHKIPGFEGDIIYKEG